MSAPGPLAGWRVVVTRAGEQAGELVALLEQAGAVPLEAPTIEIGPPSDGGAALEAVLSSVEAGDWICLTSANALRAVVSSKAGRAALSRANLAAVGRATATALEQEGFSADLVAPKANAEALAAALDGPAGRSRAILPQSSRARSVLADSLGAAGWEVVTVEAYVTRTRPGDPELAARLPGCQAIVFSSPSTFEGFMSAYGEGLLPGVIVSIGPVTTAAICSRGLEVAAEAAVASSSGLVSALLELAGGGEGTTK